jgi:glutamate dehydrogenase/leucine dehydrogenase
MSPEQWGPPFWTILHSTAASCKTKKQVKAFTYFFQSMTNIINCPQCKQHVTVFMQTHNIKTYRDYRDSYNNRIGPLMYTSQLHNSVNKKMGKVIVPWENVHDKWMK